MKTIRANFVFASLIVLIFPFASQAQHLTQVAGRSVETDSWQGKNIRYISGEVSIKVAANASPSEIQLLFDRHDAKVIDPVDELDWGTIQIPENRGVLSTAQELKRSPVVIEAGPNGVISNHADPNDPYFLGNSPASYAHQWGLKNTAQSPPGGTNDADIDAELAWDRTTGDSDVVIAVLDTGIPMQNGSPSHPDLDDSNKIILGPDYAGDGSGVKDERGHGTHVAGIAAAETNNSSGIAGVCWDCKLLVIQILDKYGNGDWATFYNGVKFAVDYAVTNNVDLVINASVGGPEDMNGRAEDAIKYADDHDVLLAVSTGNESGGAVTYPAVYSSSYTNVVSVSSSDANDSFSSFSSKGSEVVVAAPGGFGSYLDGLTVRLNGPFNKGENIYSTTPNYSFTIQFDPEYQGDPYVSDITQSYGYLPGTSMAAPHVAGTAGLIYSINPLLSASEVRTILESTAEDVNGGGFDNKFGHGRLNASEAVTEAFKHAVTPSNLVVTNAGQVNVNPVLDWNGNIESGFDHFKVYRCQSYYSSCNWQLIGQTTTSSYTDFGVSIKEKEDADDRHTYYVKAVYTSGVVSYWSNLASVWGITPFLRTPSAFDAEEGRPETFALDNTMPNPANQSTTVRFALPEAVDVTLTVYDILGREVARPMDTRMSYGVHRVQVDTSDLPSGTYLYRLRAGAFTQTKRMVIIR